VVGLDIAEPMLVAARHRVDSSAFCCVVADAQALPFGNACFDAVVCQLSLMFLPDPARGLQEMRRVLRSGHRVAVSVISTPDRANVWGALAGALSRQVAAYWRTVENGVGMLPQAYRALPAANQREVRNEVQAELGKYSSDGQLELSLETLIGAGRA
jgi:ubiquinone/menaquinone biosynthesis C-methylase UbiE